MRAKNTDTLIDTLSADTKPAPRFSAVLSLGLALLAALAICCVFVLISGQMREDFFAALSAVAMKAGFSILLALSAAPALLWLVRPGRSAGLLIALGIAVACLAVVVGTLAIMAGRGDLAAALGAGGQPIVFLVIPVLALPAGAVLFSWCRRFAPTRLMLAGAAAGAISGGISAGSYALICPVDEALFIATWYTASVVACSLIGAILGRSFLRW